MSEDEFQEILQNWLRICFSFIEKGDREEIRKQISDGNRNIAYQQIGKPCPTCHEVMEGRHIPQAGVHPPAQSITVEHIIPRTLGGNNTPPNLVGMCHLCNCARNLTMMTFMPEHEKMFGKKLTEIDKEIVVQFIEWVLRTVHTPSSSKVDSKLTEIFNQHRNEQSAVLAAPIKPITKSHGKGKNHLNKEKYFCPACDEKFSKWSIALNHKRITGHGSYICSDCSEILHSKKVRDEHIAQTGHKQMTGEFFGQRMMSTKNRVATNGADSKFRQTDGGTIRKSLNEIRDLLKEILQTQKAIQERLGKSHWQRFKLWIRVLFNRKKQKSKQTDRILSDPQLEYLENCDSTTQESIQIPTVRLETEVLVGIKGFSTAGSGFRMPRDPQHVKLIIEKISEMKLEGMTYSEVLTAIRLFVGRSPPPGSEHRLMTRIKELSEREFDDQVDVGLLSNSIHLTSRLHESMVEVLIPASEIDFDVGAVNAYYWSIDSKYEMEETIPPQPSEVVIPTSQEKAGQIKGFSTASQGGQASLVFPQEASLLVTFLRTIEARRSIEQSWDECFAYCQEFSGLSGYRCNSAIRAIRDVTRQENVTNVNWGSIPKPLELLALLELYCKNKLLNEDKFLYLDLEKTLFGISDYFKKAKAAFEVQ